MFRHSFYVTDDRDCHMHNVILGLDFGEKAGLIFDLKDKRVYYKDTFLIMTTLDEPYRPDVRDVFGEEARTTKKERINLPENDLNRIGEIRDEQEAVVNLIVRVSELVRLPARTQMAVKARFEHALSEDTVVMIEPTHDLLEKHGQGPDTPHTRGQRRTAVIHGQHHGPGCLVTTSDDGGRSGIN